MLKCAHCGEVAVDESENEPVCHACGIVQEDIKFQPSDCPPPSFRPFSRYTAFEVKLFQTKKPSRSVKQGLQVIESISHSINVSRISKSTITQLFEQICSARRFRCKEDAGVLAACCFFELQRKHIEAIPIKDMCNFAQCSKGKFSFYLKVVKNFLPVFQKDANVQEESIVRVKTEDSSGICLPSVVSSLIWETCNRADRVDQNELKKKVTALVTLVADCWLLTGRSPRGIVVACTYLCWKSMDTSRRKVSFNRFCSAFEVNEPTARRRISEIRALLVKLGSQIPSYGPDLVTKRNFLFHLDAILENSETLRNDLLHDIHTSEAIDQKEYSAFRFPSKRRPRKEPMFPVEYDTDMNASDIEISDTEIESYLCTDAKRKIIELIKKCPDDY